MKSELDRAFEAAPDSVETLQVTMVREQRTLRAFVSPAEHVTFLRQKIRAGWVLVRTKSVVERKPAPPRVGAVLIFERDIRSGRSVDAAGREEVKIWTPPHEKSGPQPSRS